MHFMKLRGDSWQLSSVLNQHLLIAVLFAISLSDCGQWWVHLFSPFLKKKCLYASVFSSLASAVTGIISSYKLLLFASRFIQLLQNVTKRQWLLQQLFKSVCAMCSFFCASLTALLIPAIIYQCLSLIPPAHSALWRYHRSGSAESNMLFPNLYSFGLKWQECWKTDSSALHVNLGSTYSPRLFVFLTLYFMSDSQTLLS